MANRAFDGRRLAYGANYDSTQACSPAFRDYLDGLVDHLVSGAGVSECRVVEVGCGDGGFLRKLVLAGNNRGHGFDPSYTGQSVDLGGRVRFERRRYDRSCGRIQADVIVCRHVIEHVPDPVGLLRTMRRSVARSPRPTVFVETPSLEWILRNRVIWDLFYEHCSYFTAASLTTALGVAGLAVRALRPAFGGQYLWSESVPAARTDGSAVPRGAGAVPDSTWDLAASEGRLVAVWRARIRELGTRGGVALWGAGAKGVTLANLVDPDRALIACLIDLNPGKQGRYVPGTGHPIVGPEDLSAYGVSSAVVMNPNYREEILALLRRSRSNVDLVELTDSGS